MEHNSIVFNDSKYAGHINAQYSAGRRNYRGTKENY